MHIFSDPRFDPVDINSSAEYFPAVTTPEVMALHMTRQWQAASPSTDTHTLDAIYAMWLEAYRRVHAWHDAHPNAAVEDARSSAERIFAHACRERGIPLAIPGAKLMDPALRDELGS